MSTVYRIASLGLVALLLFFVDVVLGQQSAPTDYKSGHRKRPRVD